MYVCMYVYIHIYVYIYIYILVFISTVQHGCAAELYQMLFTRAVWLETPIVPWCSPAPPMGPAAAILGIGRPKLQKRIARQLRAARTAQLLEGLTKQQRNWVGAASVGEGDSREVSPGASDWLFAAPSHPLTVMYNRYWAIALALRLQCHIAPKAATCMVTFSVSSSPCGAALDAKGWHGFGCARGCIQGRHDRWVALWTQAAVEAGCTAKAEQIASELVLPANASKARSDVRIDSIDAPWPVFLDIKIVATQQRVQGLERVSARGILVEAAQREKMREWQLPPQEAGRLRPIVAETQGRRGPEAVSTHRALAVRADAAVPGSFGPYLHRWRQRLAVALQLANARVIFASLGGM